MTGGSLPTGLNISGNTVSGTPVVDGQSCQITVTAYNDYESGGVSKQFTLIVASIPRINTVSPLRAGILNQSYGTLQFSAAGLTPIT